MRRDIGEQWSASSACGWVLSFARLLHSLLPYNWGGLLLFGTQTFWCRRLFFLLLLLRFFVPAADCCSPWNCSVTYPVSCWSWLPWQTAAESFPPPPRRRSICGWVGRATHNKTQQQGGVEPLPCLLPAANSASFRPLKNLSLASSSLFFSHSLCSTLPRPPVTTSHGIQHMMVHTCMRRVKEHRRIIRCCCSSSKSGAPKAFVLELAGCGARSQDDCSIMDASMEHQQMGIHTWIDGTRIQEAARFLRRRHNPSWRRRLLVQGFFVADPASYFLFCAFLWKLCTSCFFFVFRCLHRSHHLELVRTCLRLWISCSPRVVSDSCCIGIGGHRLLCGAPPPCLVVSSSVTSVLFLPPYKTATSSPGVCGSVWRLLAGGGIHWRIFFFFCVLSCVLHLLVKKEFCGGGGGRRQQAFCGVLLLARALAALLLTVVSSLAPQLLYFSNRVQAKQASKALT